MRVIHRVKQETCHSVHRIKWIGLILSTFVLFLGTISCAGVLGRYSYDEVKNVHNAKVITLTLLKDMNAEAGKDADGSRHIKVRGIVSQETPEVVSETVKAVLTQYGIVSLPKGEENDNNGASKISSTPE